MEFKELGNVVKNGGMNVILIDKNEDFYINSTAFNEISTIKKYYNYIVHAIWIDEKEPLLLRVEITAPKK